ncbi:hypothetical protein QPK32_20840 [Massilia sp. YIM B02763]|uniref:hypothetical protein n=1 Tax=Massilia sp. YIM B02763 TaxID=3050130 RepID=UPI0025B64AA5|nr:hypothetical protein [Massilia sp. YIM B02763]MDN4055519.1 hypothetical protein [Massilia sp. YIM B02763]
MTNRFSIGSILALSLSMLLAACGTTPEAVPHEAPPPPVTSVAEADQQLAAVARERAAIEARFNARVTVCYAKFFVNNCLDEAKEQRRTALAAQRAIEVQAQRFKREAVVENRDRQVAEAERRFQEKEAELAAQPPKPKAEPKPPAAPPKPTLAKREADHAKRVQEEERKDAQQAGKRAQNVRNYEERKAESEKRQAKVAQRKAERAAKEAKEAEQKAKDAAAGK